MVGQLTKNADGVPLPSDGIYWSLTHKPKYVGAVVGSARVGIDLEKISSRSKALFKRTADEGEWALGDSPSWELFYRYWTSKEAVVKAVGSGILKDLSECRVIEIIDQTLTCPNCFKSLIHNNFLCFRILGANDEKC